MIIAKIIEPAKSFARSIIFDYSYQSSINAVRRPKKKSRVSQISVHLKPETGLEKHRDDESLKQHCGKSGEPNRLAIKNDGWPNSGLCNYV